MTYSEDVKFIWHELVNSDHVTMPSIIIMNNVPFRGNSEMTAYY